MDTFGGHFLWTLFVDIYKKKSFLSISVHFGIGAIIRIGREIQCLPYAGFKKKYSAIASANGAGVKLESM